MGFDKFSYLTINWSIIIVAGHNLLFGWFQSAHNTTKNNLLENIENANKEYEQDLTYHHHLRSPWSHYDRDMAFFHYFIYISEMKSENCQNNQTQDT